MADFYFFIFIGIGSFFVQVVWTQNLQGELWPIKKLFCRRCNGVPVIVWQNDMFLVERGPCWIHFVPILGPLGDHFEVFWSSGPPWGPTWPLQDALGASHGGP